MNALKLYTRDEIKLMLEGMGTHTEESVEYFLDELTPIELPSDEEIENYIKSFPYTKHLDDGQYNDGVLVGVELGIEWVIDKIKNQQ